MKQKSAPQRILVTGGAGFIGSHLSRRLVSEGHELHVMHRPKGDLRRLQDFASAMRLWECDLVDRDRLEVVLDAVKPEVIFHLAGDSSLRHVDPALACVTESIERNVRPSINLLLAAKAHGAMLRSFIRLGGLEEYGLGPAPYTESQREQPVSPYSASQVAVTHYFQMLAPHLSFPAITVRPALIYGPAQSTRFFIPALIEHCFRGRDFSMSSGSQGRDLLYIDDLVDALLLLLETPLPTAEILNIGAAREYIMTDVASAIIRLTGAKIRLLKNTPPRPSEVQHLFCSAQKARDLLDWQPSVDLEEGLKRSIESFREQIPLP